MRNDFISLIEQSIKVKKELNARETLQNIPTDGNMGRKIKMQVDKIQRRIIQESAGVNNIIKKQQPMPNDLVGSGASPLKPSSCELTQAVPSTSYDTSVAGFQKLDTAPNTDMPQIPLNKMDIASVHKDDCTVSKDEKLNSSHVTDGELKLENLDTDVDLPVGYNRDKDDGPKQSSQTKKTEDQYEADNEMEMSDYSSDFDTASDMDVNVLLPEVFKRFQCALREKRYVDKRSFDSHVDMHTGVSYLCEKCSNRRFTNSQAF